MSRNIRYPKELCFLAPIDEEIVGSAILGFASDSPERISRFATVDFLPPSTLSSLQIDAAPHPPVVDDSITWRVDFSTQNTTSGFIEGEPSSAISAPWGMSHHVSLTASTHRDVSGPSVRRATVGSQMSDPRPRVAS